MSISLHSTGLNCIIPCTDKNPLSNKGVDPIHTIGQGIPAGDPGSLQIQNTSVTRKRVFRLKIVTKSKYLCYL